MRDNVYCPWPNGAKIVGKRIVKLSFLRKPIQWLVLLCCMTNAGPVQSEVAEGGREFFIDKTGKVVLNLPPDCHARFPQYFADGLAVVQKGPAFGYIDKKGNIAIKAVFAEAEPFSEGLAAVREDSGKYGYIDVTGKIQIEPNFEYAAPFIHDIALVKLKDKVSYIKRSGKLLSKKTFDDGGSFSKLDGLAPVRIGTKWGYIDLHGKITIPPNFSWAMRFNEGLACVGDRKTGHALFINTFGKAVFEAPAFVLEGKMRTFSEGMAAVRLGGSAGKSTYISKNGTRMEAQFDRVNDFHEGLASVIKEKMAGFINKEGKPISPFSYTDTSDFSEGLAAVFSSGKWGYIESNGEQAIAPRFTRVQDFKEGLAFVVIP
jgi:hypothetical protein